MSSTNFSNTHHLTDTNQSFWQLASIQLTGVTSLPVLFSSVLLIQKNSFINSVIILAIANLFLWIVRYGLIRMSFDGRKSVIDIAKEYLGDIWGFKNAGIYLIAALLLLSALFFFIEITTIVCNALTEVFSINEGPNIDPFMQISVIVGTFSTIFCTWGIVALRRLSVFSFPVILVAFALLVMYAPSDIHFLENQSFSLMGVSRVLAINLAITADLPTFFRHSQSWKTSIRALFTIQLLTFVLGIGGLFLGKIIQPIASFPIVSETLHASLLLQIAFVSLVFLSSICSNVSNVYGASVGWEIFCKNALVGIKEYLILGFLMTLIFLIVTGLFSLEYFTEVFSDSLVNMSLVFVVGYLTLLLAKCPFGRFEKNVFFGAWVLSTFATILTHSNLLFTSTPPLVIGFITILLIISILCGTKAGILAFNKRTKL